MAHFIGWMGKGLLIRDVRLCVALSFLWELLELSLFWILPNFAECWWDSFVLDFLVCNGTGLYCGVQLAKYLEMREFDWLGAAPPPLPPPLQSKGVRHKMKRFAQQFTPHHWLRVEWRGNKKNKQLQKQQQKKMFVF